MIVPVILSGNWVHMSMIDLSAEMPAVRRTYKIPLVWSTYGKLSVEASSLQEAIELAVGPDYPLPEGYYLDDSICVDMEALKEENNY